MNNNSSGGFLNGFLWGVIIGGAAVFLLGTKKGKNILKLISEESLELSELFGEEEREELNPKKAKESESENGEVATASSPRRFFRGIPKKS